MLTRELRLRIVKDAKEFGLMKALDWRRNYHALEACQKLINGDVINAQINAQMAIYLDNLSWKFFIKKSKEARNG